MHTPCHPFVVVVQFEYGTVRREDEVFAGLPWELAEISIVISFEKHDIGHFKLLCSLGLIA